MSDIVIRISIENPDAKSSGEIWVNLSQERIADIGLKKALNEIWKEAKEHMLMKSNRNIFKPKGGDRA